MHDEPVPPATTSTGRWRPSGLTSRTGIPKSEGRPAAASADEDTTPPPSTQRLLHSVLRRVFFAVPLIILIFIIIFLPVARFVALQDVRSINDRILSNWTGVLILGHGIQLDLDAGVLSILWGVVVCGANTTSVDPFWDARIPVGCKPYEEPLVVHLNDLSNPVFSSIPHTQLISKRVGIWDPPMFIAEHRFDKYGKRNPTENLMVPFQRYSFNAFVVAIDPGTNLSVHIDMFGILDTLGDFVIQSQDVVATSELTYDSGNGLVTTEVQSRLLRAEITQSRIAKTFAICLFLANWMVTVGSVYITALVASRMLDANSMLAALPFSAPLTIPAVRFLYTNSPLLGTSMDAVAFFVQIATAGLCSLFLFGVLASRQSPSSSQGRLPI